MTADDAIVTCSCGKPHRYDTDPHEWKPPMTDRRYKVLHQPDIHHHALPRFPFLWERGSIVECDCGKRFWRCQSALEGACWRPLRWYHWRLRRTAP